MCSFKVGVNYTNPMLLRFFGGLGVVLTLIGGSAKAALDCNVDGIVSAGVFEPSANDVARLLHYIVNFQAGAGSCVGLGCDFNGDGIAPNVGDLAALLKISQGQIDQTGVCLNAGDTSTFPVVTMVMSSNGGAVPNDSTIVVKRDGTGMPSLTMTMSDPNGDLQAGTLAVAYKYGDLSFDITSLFTAGLSGNQVSFGGGTSSLFFQTGFSRHSLTNLSRLRNDLVQGSVPDSLPVGTGSGTLIFDATGNKVLRYANSGAITVQATLPANGVNEKPVQWAISPAANRVVVQVATESGGNTTNQDNLKIFDLSGNAVAQPALVGGAAKIAVHDAAGLVFVLHQSDRQTLSVFRLNDGGLVVSQQMPLSLNSEILVSTGTAGSPKVVVMSVAGGVIYVRDANTLNQAEIFVLDSNTNSTLWILNLAAWDSVSNRLIFVGGQGGGQNMLHSVSLASGLDSPRSVQSQTGTGARPTSLAVAGGVVYTASNEDLTLRKFDAATLNETASLKISSKVSGLSVDGSELAVVMDLLDPEGNVPSLITASVKDAANHTGIGRASLILATDTIGGFRR